MATRHERRGHSVGGVGNGGRDDPELAVNSLYSLAEIEAIVRKSDLLLEAKRGKIKVANVVDIHNLSRLELKART